MFSFKTAMFLFLIFILAAAPVAAGGNYHHGCGTVMQDMTTMDNNQDQVLTFEEFSAPQENNLRTAFDMLDTDDSGGIDPNEWDAFLSIHGYGKNS